MEALSGPNSDESDRTRLSPQSFENAIQNLTDADSLHFGQLRRHLAPSVPSRIHEPRLSRICPRLAVTETNWWEMRDLRTC